MNPLLAAAADLQAVCQEEGWRFCFIGGLAVQRWGEPRLTRDVDLTLLTGFGGEAPYVDGLLERFEGRVSDARGFALQSRVVLARAGNGVPLDIALGAMPFEQRAVARATPYRFTDGATLVTCSAEDLVVMKAFGGRMRDWADIEGIVLRQGERLDQELIRREVRPLLELKDAVGDLDRVDALLEDGQGQTGPRA